ncbi:MAG: hypothetical protein IJT21_05760 [Synergistaceae bacterium]|nr:hypothetical protein [Synergistaceae bacterium]
MSEIKIYAFKDCNIRTIKIDGEYWFCVKDLCRGLQICRSSDVVRRALRGEKTRKFSVPIDVNAPSRESSKRRNTLTKSPCRECLFTDESGVYTLIMRSNKPQAQEFRHWVTNEVLPSIRKTGSYTIPQIRDAQEESQMTRNKITFEVLVKIEDGASVNISESFPAGTTSQKVSAMWCDMVGTVNSILCTMDLIQESQSVKNYINEL